jgi:glycogen phosphorylase
MYHLNEGHAAFLTLHLLRRHRRPEEVRDRCIFTTHTPVEAGHDRFSYKLFEHTLPGYVDVKELKALAGADRLNMTELALNLSGFVNGVARRHAEVTRELFPGYQIHAVTNGVHVRTWAHPNFARLYQEKFPNWAHEPEMLVHADQFADATIWEAHQGAKHDLLALVKQRCGIDLRPDVPVIGYARRMTGYKRPALVFSDMQRLAAIARQWPFQLVFAGIAHRDDGDGKAGIEQIHGLMRGAAGVPIAFIPGYDMKVGGTLVAGADVWLNTPMPPLEASGTSGMKAALNGVLNFSVLDGWWLEAWVEGTTGWAIGDALGPSSDHASELYRKLASTILPLYHKDRGRWIWMMKQSIKIAAHFNSQRMMRRYASEAYVR